MFRFVEASEAVIIARCNYESFRRQQGFDYSWKTRDFGVICGVGNPQSFLGNFHAFDWFYEKQIEAHSQSLIAIEISCENFRSMLLCVHIKASVH